MDTTTESLAWFTASTESTDRRKRRSDHADLQPKSTIYTHRQLQYLPDSKSLGLDKSSLPTLLMLLHLLSITIMSKVYGGIEMMINMVVQEAIACLPL